VNLLETIGDHGYERWSSRVAWPAALLRVAPMTCPQGRPVECLKKTGVASDNNLSVLMFDVQNRGHALERSSRGIWQEGLGSLGESSRTGHERGWRNGQLCKIQRGTVQYRQFSQILKEAVYLSLLGGRRKRHYLAIPLNPTSYTAYPRT
jgi:hypothetical protein